MVNPLTAALGAFNIVLYAGAYTLLKRRTVWNTYVGAVVGAIPPVMGWTACGGQLIPSSPYPIHFFPPSFLSSLPPADLALISSSTADNPLAPLALFAFLFCWQFPHFNSLSHLIRASYAQAGYRMLSVTSPAKNALESLQYAAVLVPICSILIPASGLTSWAFALTSLPVNAVALRAAWRFWKDGKERSARTVTQYSLLYLPVMLGLMMFHKHGMEWSKWLGLSSGEGQVEPNRQA
jgi:protoheme IX farnesyltransferase